MAVERETGESGVGDEHTLLQVHALELAATLEREREGGREGRREGGREGGRE